jgi:hypothetical protein
MAFFNPFCSEEAISHSNYCTLQKADYKSSKLANDPLKQTTKKVAGELSALLADAAAPQQLLGNARRRSCSFGVYPELGSTEATAGLCRDLARFLHEYRERPSSKTTFMAVFATSASISEALFEQKVEEQIAILQKAAEPFYCLPESEKEKQPPAYRCVTFGGKILKVISLYRNSSHGHLKFKYPMLAFSLQTEEKKPERTPRASASGKQT